MLINIYTNFWMLSDLDGNGSREAISHNFMPAVFCNGYYAVVKEPGELWNWRTFTAAGKRYISSHDNSYFCLRRFNYSWSFNYISTVFSIISLWAYTVVSKMKIVTCATILTRIIHTHINSCTLIGKN